MAHLDEAIACRLVQSDLAIAGIHHLGRNSCGDARAPRMGGTGQLPTRLAARCV